MTGESNIKMVLTSWFSLKSGIVPCHSKDIVLHMRTRILQVTIPGADIASNIKRSCLDNPSSIQGKKQALSWL